MDYMTPVKLKKALEHAQNVQMHIILRMRKVSSGPLLSIDIWYQMSFAADSEGPDQTAQTRSLIWAFAVRACPENKFSLGATHIKVSLVRFASFNSTVEAKLL